MALPRSEPVYPGLPDGLSLLDLGHWLLAQEPEEVSRLALEGPRGTIETFEAAMDAAENVVRAVNEPWRADPASMAHHLTGGDYKMYSHVRLLSKKFVEAVRGIDVRQLWNLASQTGKTSLLMQCVIWALDDDPRRRVMYVSYDADKAIREAGEALDFAREHADVLRFTLRPDIQARGRWNTVQGGGLYATGVGGSITGYPAEIILADDLIKGWVEAHSARTREITWNVYKSQMRLRLQSESNPIILAGTRWHPRDPTGMALAEQGQDVQRWTLIRIPHLAELPNLDDPIPEMRQPDPLGRAPGEPLEKFSLEEVLARARTLGTYLSAGLEQQRPAPEEGGELKRAWWKWETVLPRQYDDAISCLAGDTLVFTAEGPRRIDEVRVGEKVWSLDEHSKTFRLSRVWKSEQSGTDDLLRIETRGFALRANAQHRVLVRRKFPAPRPGKGGNKCVEWRNVWVPAGELVKGDYLMAANGMPDQLGDVAPNGRVLTEGFMAFAGLLIGDGSVLKSSVAIARHPDAPYKEAYKRFAEEEFQCGWPGHETLTEAQADEIRSSTERGVDLAKRFGVHQTTISGIRHGTTRHLPRPLRPIRWLELPGRMSMTFNSVSACSELRELGLAGVARTKRVPEWVFGLRPNLVLAFLRGYLDADGAVNIRGHVIYSSVNPQLLEDVRHLMMLVGIPVSRLYFYRMAGQVVVAGRTVTRGDIYQIQGYDVLSNRRIGAHHPRKAERLMVTPKLGKGRGPQRWSPDYRGNDGGPAHLAVGLGFNIQGVYLERIRAITPEPAEPVYDLGVEGTHSFIASGLVVHNSWDVSFKDKETSDYVVGQVWGRTGGDFWMAEMLRGQWGMAMTKLAVALLAVRHPYVNRHYIENTGNGPEVMQELRAGHRDYEVTDEQAGALGMTEAERVAVQLLIRRGLSGLLPVNPKGSKEVRARAEAGILEAGNCHLLAGDPAALYLVEEAAAFSNGSWDDAVDSWSQAMSKLARGAATVAASSGQVSNARASATPPARPGLPGLGGPGLPRFPRARIR